MNSWFTPYWMHPEAVSPVIITHTTFDPSAVTRIDVRMPELDRTPALQSQCHSKFWSLERLVDTIYSLSHLWSSKLTLFRRCLLSPAPVAGHSLYLTFKLAKLNTEKNKSKAIINQPCRCQQVCISTSSTTLRGKRKYTRWCPGIRTRAIIGVDSCAIQECLVGYSLLLFYQPNLASYIYTVRCWYWHERFFHPFMKVLISRATTYVQYSTFAYFTAVRYTRIPICYLLDSCGVLARATSARFEL